MKNFLFIPVAIVIMSLVSCKTSPDETFGEWRAVHIFYKGEDLLNNDYIRNGWSIEYHRTKFFYLGGSPFNDLTLNLGWHDDPPILADIRVLNTKDSLDFEVYNSSDNRFNGVYSRKIEKDTVWQDGFRVAYCYLTLESKDTKIMALRNKVLP